MEHLQDITVEELHESLERTEDKKPTLRLIAAIAYLHGITQSELAEWFDVERKTIYNWLKRLEAENLNEAVQDVKRPGRPRKLDEEELNELEEILHNPPIVAGYDVPGWTVELVQHLIQDEFDCEYSQPSCRRLMKELGLRYQKYNNPAILAGYEDSSEIEEKLPNTGYIWLPEEHE